MTLKLQNSIFFTLLLGICVLFSCSSSNQSDLKIRVTGTLSGNPRSNIEVTLYETEEDAEDQKNVLRSAETNASGNVKFRNVEKGRVFWVRAQATLSKSIEKTQAMKSGNNYFSMTIL